MDKMLKHQFKIKNLYRLNDSDEIINKSQTTDIAETKLFIEGFASHVAKDRVNDIVMPNAFEKSLIQFKNNPVLLFQHDQNQPIGKITEAEITDQGLRVKAMISKTRPDIQTLIEEGVLSTFSIGFNPLEQDYDNQMKANVIKDVELLEISVVTIPANPAAAFELAEKQLEVEEQKADSNILDAISEEPQNEEVSPNSLKSQATKAESYFALALAVMILAKYKGLKNNISYNNINEIIALSCDKYGLSRECLKSLILNLRSKSVSNKTDEIIREVLAIMAEKITDSSIAQEEKSEEIQEVKTEEVQETKTEEKKDSEINQLAVLTEMMAKLDLILGKMNTAPIEEKAEEAVEEEKVETAEEEKSESVEEEKVETAEEEKSEEVTEELSLEEELLLLESELLEAELADLKD